MYNSRLGKEKVVELSANTNTCIEQNVRNLAPGLYQLKYEYAAREGISLTDCQFKVSFENKELKKVTPQNHNVNTDILKIEVKSESNGRVEFCGFGGLKNSYGAIIKSVSLIKKADLPILSIPNTKLPLNIGIIPEP